MVDAIYGKPLSRAVSQVVFKPPPEDWVLALRKLLEHDNFENRDRIREVYERDPIFRPYYQLSLEDQRELALRRMKTFAGHQLISVRDFDRNIHNIYTCHELFGYIDPSWATKMTVQFNLFGGTLYRMGSQAHRDEYTQAIDQCQVIGCFGLTEVGYGNNAVEMETRATYVHDANGGHFLIDTPTNLSQKYWITNGACHAHVCIVFAQLYVNQKNEGVHGFLVPIRDLKTHEICPQVEIHEMGHKIGLNGVDNAKLRFSQVKIPRENMLTKDAEVEADGKYVWKGPKASRRDRFLKLADQLLSGRLCIAAMMLGSIKFVLTNTLLYSESRLGVGPTGKSDTPIGRYSIFRGEVFPLLARYFATQFFFNACKDRISNRSDKEQLEVLVLCSSVKPYTAWLCEKVVSICRERVGGPGCLSINGFGEMFAHAGITAEGDARVLCAKVCKELLELVSKGQATFMSDLCPPKPINEVLGHPSSPTFLVDMRAVFGHRFRLEVEHLREAFEEGVKSGKSLYELTMSDLSWQIQGVSRCYYEFECLRSLCRVMPGPSGSQVLESLALIFVVSVLKEDPMGYHQKLGLDPKVLQAMERVLQDKYEYLGQRVPQLVETLNVRPNWRPIANDWQMYNQADNVGEVLV